MKVAELTQTCSACPSQWEGRLEDGSAIYIRYRWGRLGVAVAPTMEEALDLFCSFSDVGWYFEAHDISPSEGDCLFSDVVANVPQVDFSAVNP